MFYPTVSSFFESEGDFEENLDADDDIREILDIIEPDPWRFSAEPGSPVDRGEPAYNRESYFR